ncbi:unnamed protein product [Prunus armeniaca]
MQAILRKITKYEPPKPQSYKCSQPTRSLLGCITEILYPVAEPKRGVGRSRSTSQQNCKLVHLFQGESNVEGTPITANWKASDIRHIFKGRGKLSP